MVFDHIDEKEAVKTAALIEKNGYRFYTLLGERTESKEARAVFRKLAEDEKKHLKVLEKKFFPEAGFTDQITDEEMSLEGYLEKSGAGDIFTRRIDVDGLVRLVDTTKKALIIALDTERYSVDFFGALSAKASTPEGRKMYRELAEEEREHVRAIEGLLR